MAFATFAARRAAAALPAFLFVILVTFLIIHLVPGDPVDMILGDVPRDPAIVLRLRSELGLSDPLPTQLFRYLGNVLQGNLGHSYQSSRPVTSIVSERLPYTLLLAFAGVALGFLLGLPIGVWAAIRGARARRSEVGFNLVTSGLVATPDFLLATVLAFVFAVWLGVLPVAGADEGPRSLILPALALAIPLAGLQARVVNASLADVLQQDFVRTLRAVGIRERRLMIRNVLRNAMVPIIALLGVEFARLLGGTLIVENVFAWPGMGTVMFSSITNRDLPAVQGEILTIALVIIITNFLVDLLTRVIDPRTRA
jgi:peptide/nickel transport system permease protein